MYNRCHCRLPVHKSSFHHNQLRPQIVPYQITIVSKFCFSRAVLQVSKKGQLQLDASQGSSPLDSRAKVLYLQMDCRNCCRMGLETLGYCCSHFFLPVYFIKRVLLSHLLFTISRTFLPSKSFRSNLTDYFHSYVSFPLCVITPQHQH